MDAHQPNGSSLGIYLLAGCFIAVCLVLSGCVTPDPSVDLLEGELRWMEDQLYMMEDQLEQRCQELVSCRESKNGQPCNCNKTPTPAAPRSRAYDYDSYEDDQYESNSGEERYESGSGSRNKPTGNDRSYGDEARDSDSLPSPSGETLQNQNRKIPQLLESPDRSRIKSPASGSNFGDSDFDTDTDFDVDTLPPKVDLGTGTSGSSTSRSGNSDGSSFDDLEDLLSEPDIQLPEPEAAPRGVRPELESAGPEDSTGTVAPLILSEDVDQLQLNAARVSLHAEGVDQEKLLVVVEPQSGANRYVEMSAPVRVVLEDVNHGGIYFNSWEFTALETGRTLRESKMGRGIHLALDWPKDVPLLDELRVSVVYHRIDGEEVRADKMLHPKVQTTTTTTTMAGWVPVARSLNQGSDEVASSLMAESDQFSNSIDPFDLAERSGPVAVAQIFKTVPIATIVEQKGSVATTWSEPIPLKSEAVANQKLTPISDVQLEPVSNTLRDKIFGSGADGSVTSGSAIENQPMETIPITAAAMPAETTPKESIPVEASATTEPLATGRSRPDSTAGSKWTPYR